MALLLQTLDAEGLGRFRSLEAEAVEYVWARFRAMLGPAQEHLGPAGEDACREDLAFHLEFLRPVLEFGLLDPMVEYLRWVASVLAARAIPAEHLALSLDWLADFFATRMDGRDAVVVGTALRAARDRFAQGGAAVAAPRPPDPWPQAAALESALLAGDQREVLALVERCLEDGHSLVDVELHLVQPALYGIGEKWQANQVSVAQEHLASAIVQSVMTMALLRMPPTVPVDNRVLLACVAGNEHAIGLRMVADAFQLAGWEVQYLGPNVPAAALVAQVSAWKPDLVALSVAFPHQLRAARQAITSLAAALGNARPPVMVGGLAINRFAPLADVLGADASVVDAGAAVARARALVRS